MTEPAPPRSELVERLAAVVGASHVLVDRDVVAPYLTDWSRRWRGAATAVVRPGSTDEVSRLLALCTDLGVAVVPQGGNTGLVGGSVPDEQSEQPSIVLSTRRLDTLGEVDQLSGQVTVGSGVTLGDLRRHATAAGWAYGVDLAARDSATVGGTVATNAGGIHVIAYGMTRAQLVGIEAVLPGGSIVSHLSGMLKDNTGYDLAGLLCGSEGTLGVITAVRVRLHHPPGRSTVCLIGCDSYAHAMDVMSGAVAPGVQLLAAEVVDEAGLELAAARAGTGWPLARRHPVAVLLEVVDGGDATGLRGIDDLDVVVGLDAAEQARIWALRESQAEAFSALGVTHKLDVSVPLSVLAACAEELRGIVSSHPDVRAFGVFGHLADGNIHLEIFGPDADDVGLDRAVLECVARYEGSVSAEHGIGRAKAGDLHLCRSTAEIAAMRAIKAAWDPRGLMNPGVLFAADG